MTPYIAVFSLLSMFAVTNYFRDVRYYKKLFVLLSVVILILFAGLRKADVGADDLVYIRIFKDVPDVSLWLFGKYKYSFADFWMEPGYLFLNAVIKFLSTSYVFLFMIVALISVGIASYNYVKYSPYVFLSLLLFFVHTFLYRDMNQIRSAIAAAMGLFLIGTFQRKQHIRSFFIICFAAMFHAVAMSYFLVYFMSFIKMTRVRYFVGEVAAIGIGLAGGASKIFSIIPGFSYISIKLAHYSDSKFADAIGVFDITNIKNLMILNLMLIFRRKFIAKCKYFDVLLLFFFVGTAWRIAFSDFSIIAARVSTFFTIVEVLVIPILVLIFRQKMFITLLVIIYAFMMLYLNMYVKEMAHPYIISIF